MTLKDRARKFAPELLSLSVVFFLISLCPLAFALGVASNVADDPGIVDGEAIERQWWAWALSSRFLVFLPIGATVALLGICLSTRDRRITRAAISFACVGLATFVSACASGWILFR